MLLFEHKNDLYGYKAQRDIFYLTESPFFKNYNEWLVWTMTRFFRIL